MTATADFVTANDHAYDVAARYGVSLSGPQGYIETDDSMPLAELVAQGGRVIRVRFIGDDYIPGRGKCYDLSYVTGQLPDGTAVQVTHLPALFLTPKHQLKKGLIDWAREERVFAKGCGLLDEGNFSILG